MALLAGACAPSSVDAHESSDPRPGLSEAARQASQSLAAVGSIQSLSGQFHILFGDAPSSGVPGIHGYVLIDDFGHATELIIDEEKLRALGGVRTINREPVTVTGETLAPPSGMQPALPLLAVQTVQPNGPQRTASMMAAAQAVSGPQPWATILCRFADYATVTPNPVSYFQGLVLGTTAPAVDHFWREISYNNVNLTGSAVYGWYTLPNPRSYYVYGNPLQLDFGRAYNDCTGVTGINLSSFVGINLMFNTDLDGYAWGGSWASHRVTWVPPWGYENQGPIAHEMGHGFGLHHSSGPYVATYDSRWDVMSDIWESCPPNDPTYGCVGVGTIAYHKDLLGWIPGSQKYVAAPGTRQTILMERLDQPTTANYLIAQLPIAGSATQFYTVEVRRFAGYDVKVPGEAVIMHRVDTTLSDRNAKVVDPDADSNPNVGSELLLPGRSFIDSVNQFTVAVNAQVGNGFQVTITNGTVTTAATTTAVVSSANPATVGQAVTFTASVDTVPPGGGTPTGTVTFRDGTMVLGTGSLNGSRQATLTASALASGVHAITAQYAGDTSFPGSMSTPLSQSVATPVVAIVAAVLPMSRSVQVGGAPATAFAAIVNAGTDVAVNCAPAPPSTPPTGLGTFSYQATTINNVLSGSPNTPASIAPGGVQHYVFGFAPTAAIPETSLAMQFLCDNAAPASQTPGVNNLYIVASSSPIPDTIALMATVSGDGVVRIGGSGGTQLFAIGTSNVGATGTIVISGDTGGVSLPLAVTVCETNATGTCLAPPTPTVTVTYTAGTNRSFAFFARASGSIAFDPATNRVFARLRESGVLRGATSAAVCTTPNAGC